MTTDRRKPRLRTSSLELRLYVAALLGAIYAISWRAIGGHALATSAATTAPPAASEPQHFVWLESVRPDQRPTIALPPGWQLASVPSALHAQPAPVVRSPTRVRTRSS